MRVCVSVSGQCAYRNNGLLFNSCLPFRVVKTKKGGKNSVLVHFISLVFSLLAAVDVEGVHIVVLTQRKTDVNK